MNAKLPENFEAPTIDSMLPGEGGYVVPWAMWVDEKRNCWLHPDYTVSTEPAGTACMRITCKTGGLGRTFAVDLRGIEFHWSPQETPTYVGQPPKYGWCEVDELLT